MSKTLSVCIITKDNEFTIRKTLNSVKDIADEIIAVDLGSSDKTVDILKEYNAKIFPYTFNNDFSEVRNYSLEKATMEWILIINPDEEVLNSDIDRIKSIFNDSIVDGYLIYISKVVDNRIIYSIPHMRIFKNDPTFRFDGNVHEQIIHRIVNTKGQKSILIANLTLLSLGDTSNNSRAIENAKRNVSILASYEENNRDGYYYYCLGNEYLELSDPNRALECYNISLRTPAFDYGYSKTLIQRTIDTLYKLKKYEDALEYINIFTNNFPEFKDLYFYRVLCYLESMRFSKAKAALDQYLNCERKLSLFPIINFENLYNMNDIQTKISNSLIPHEENKLSLCMVVENENNNFLSSINSIAEIADEIILVGKSLSEELKTSLTQRGISVFTEDFEDYTDALNLALTQANCKWILVLEESEICSYDTCSKIVELIKDDSTSGYVFTVSIQSVFGFSTSQSEMKLFKNNYEEITSLSEYRAELENFGDKILETDVVIQKKYMN